MHVRLLLVMLLSSSLLYSMHGQAPAFRNALTDLMPPAQISMTDYENIAGSDCSWFNSKHAMDDYKAQFTKHPLYQTMSENPEEQAEILNKMIAEANRRMYHQGAPCCLAAIKPCKWTSFSLFLFVSGYNALQRGDSCALNCGLGCATALITCGQCSKYIRTAGGITKTIEKTLAARGLFTSLKTLSTAESQKKIQ